MEIQGERTWTGSCWGGLWGSARVRGMNMGRVTEGRGPGKGQGVRGRSRAWTLAWLWWGIGGVGRVRDMDMGKVIEGWGYRGGSGDVDIGRVMEGCGYRGGSGAWTWVRLWGGV